MELVIDHKSAIPLHLQAESLLRAMIKDPAYQNGKLLPNEVDLAKTLAISRTTLRQAINKLVYEDLLVRKKGYGTKVANSVISTKSKNWLSFSQEMAARGIAIKNYELHISWEFPDDALIAFFDIKPDKKILKMERLRGGMDEPFVYFISWFHPRVGLTGEEDFKKPMYEMLQQDRGIVATLSKEEITARLANKFLAAKLEVDTGSPILFRKRFVFDRNEQPIEFNLAYYKAESFVFTIESRRDSL